MNILAILSIIVGSISLLSLLMLHFTSPQYHPSWRMVSEYAYGKHKWLLTLFFILWGSSSILTSILLWDIVTTKWAMLGVALVFVSGAGAIMGGLFDVKHKHHGMSFLLGVPTLPIGALLVSYHLISLPNWSNHQSTILLSAHSIWISLVLMAVSMMAMFASFKKAGITWDKNSVPPERLPDGVTAFGGYANRLLVICYIGWIIFISKIYLTTLI
jgi:hypothetical membrane protein